MPYESIEAAKEAEFPTTAEGINLTLAQINKLASIYDAVKAAGTAENAMAVAWTSWKKLYKKEDEAWVTVESGKYYMSEIPNQNPEYIEFDVAVRNNAGNIIKIKNISIYKDEYDPPNEDKIKERLASELGYEGLGSYFVYLHNSNILIGDEITADIEPLHTVSIAVFSSSVFSGKFAAGSAWIPVAAVGQETTISNGDKISLSREALESNLDTWKGGSIKVNHEDNGEIEGLKIEDAKFKNGLLYHKVNQKLAEFIQHTASSGRSIEVRNMEYEDNDAPIKTVKSYTGYGLAVLFPPFKPSCTTDMGCSSSNLHTDTPHTDSPSAIKAIFTKLANTLKSQSFMDSMIENSGTDPNLEKTMTEETDTLKFAKMEAEKSRDEALKDNETLKFSLVEKDTALKEKDGIISDKDTLITEQTERLKFYADAEVAAAEKLREDQWEIIKVGIPLGKFHKPEDEAALKKECFADPMAFNVKMASFKREESQGESGTEHPPNTDDIVKGLDVMGIPGIEFTGGE